MLWVSVHLPHLAMELRQPQQPGPLAVTDGTGARRRVIACNATALEAGIAIGMDAPSAMMREPELRMFDRSKADERRAILALASLGPPIHQRRLPGCHTLDGVAGESARASDTSTASQPFTSRSAHGIERLGYTASIGIAPTIEAAALLTRHPDVLPILNKSEIRRAVGPLPLAGLEIGAKAIDQLHTTGLRTVEDLLERPCRRPCPAVW